MIQRWQCSVFMCEAQHVLICSLCSYLFLEAWLFILWEETHTRKLRPKISFASRGFVQRRQRDRNVHSNDCGNQRRLGDEGSFLASAEALLLSSTVDRPTRETEESSYWCRFAVCQENQSECQSVRQAGRVACTVVHQLRSDSSDDTGSLVLSLLSLDFFFFSISILIQWLALVSVLNLSRLATVSMRASECSWKWAADFCLLRLSLCGAVVFECPLLASMNDFSLKICSPSFQRFRSIRNQFLLGEKQMKLFQWHY